jgi:carbon-monoxide dehydrogenase large subunit
VIRGFSPRLALAVPFRCVCASTSHGFDEIVDAELALDKDGRILALAAEVIGDIGAYSIFPWTAALEPVQVVSFMPGPYRVPTYHGHVRAVSTCKAPTGPALTIGTRLASVVSLTDRKVTISHR